MEEMMDRIRARLAEHATLARMELVYTITAEAAASKVNTDAAGIERVLFNLTDNACKYAREAADRRIHIDVARDGTTARITVRDHGPGIPGGGKRLFQTFRKTSAGAAKSAAGTSRGWTVT